MAESKVQETIPTESTDQAAQGAEELKQEIEVFKTPACKELALSHQWTMWEHYECAQTIHFSDQMRRVCWFNDVVTFANAWNSIPHNDIHKFFYDHKTKNVNMHKVDGFEKRINGLSLFQHKISPQWEDEINEQGGEFQINFKCTSLDLVQQLWERLIFRVVTGEFPETDLIAGVRMLDKSAIDRENCFRIEVWIKINDEKLEMGERMRKYLETNFAKTLCEEPCVEFMGKGKDNATDPSVWIVFKPHSQKAHKASSELKKTKSQAQQ